MPDELTVMRILDHNRNMSAPRRDSNLRALIEYFNILKHYRGLPRAMIGRDIRARNRQRKARRRWRPSGRCSRELALLGGTRRTSCSPWTRCSKRRPRPATTRASSRLTGAIDVFAIETVRARAAAAASSSARRASNSAWRASNSARRASNSARRTSNSARRVSNSAWRTSNSARRASTCAQLRAALAEATAAQAAAARAQEASVRAQQAAARAQEFAAQAVTAKQQLADRLHAALNASYAEAVRLSDQADTAQSALQAIATHVDAITTRSRAYRMVRLFKGLRRRIEMIGAAARAGTR